MNEKEIKKTVRESYGEIARSGGSCCGSGASCCGSETPVTISKIIGYSEEQVRAVPEGANLGLGCGNPVALASLKPGEVVLDLGAGAGFDCFLAAERVGREGHVIGIDMTPDMVARARDNALKGGYTNVEFRLGEIETLPVDTSSVDAIISNCVINLSPDKARVFAEAFRVLKPGGRLMVSDIVLLKEIPDYIRDSIAAYVACVGGAVPKEQYLAAIEAAGFAGVTVLAEQAFSIDCVLHDPSVQETAQNLGAPEEALKEMAGAVVSISVTAGKPAG